MIDWLRVNELKEEVGAEDFLEVAEIFLEEVGEVIDRLAEAPDPTTYEADFHFLKGSALNLGFEALAVICAAEEKRSAAGDTQDVNVAAAIDCFRTSRAEFLGKLETDAAA